MSKNIFIINLKKSSLIILTATLVISGFFVSNALANFGATVTPTTGGEAVSIDTTSDGGSEAWTDLDGPKISEGITGDIGVGLHTITLPAGWEFNTSQTVNIGLTTGGAAGLVLHTYIVTPTANTLSFVVTVVSMNSAETLTFDHIQVRPINQSVESGNITATAGTIAGVDGTTNFGTLTTVAGIVTQVAFTTQPGSAVYGSDLDPQPVVETQDQFGNDSTSGLGSSNNVVLTLTGIGSLQGTAILDIGTSAGNGIVSFNGLTVDTVGIGNYLTANATGLTGDVSDLFDITPKAINVIAQTDSRIYDGTTNSAIVPAVDDLEFGDTIATPPIQAFDTKDVDTGKTLTPSGLGITGGNGNYDITYVDDDTGVITAKEITITGATTDSKAYDGDTTAVVDFSDASLVGKIESEDVTLIAGYSATFDTKNVGAEKTVTVTGLTLAGADAGNYSITQPVLTDGEITTRPITVTATTNTKTYDSTINAAAIPTITAGSLATGDNSNFTETYDNENVGINKTLTPSGIIDDGNGGNNYNVTYVPDTVGEITTKAVNVTAQTDTKVYDGNATSSVFPVGDALEGDDSYVSQGTQTFDNENVGVGKTLIATGASITEAANYTISYVTATGEITKKELTVINSAVASKTYDGTTAAVITGATLTGKIGGDDVTLENDDSGIFDTKNVGTNKAVTTAMTITGADAGNYTLIQPTVTGAITERAITVTPAADTKVYDKTTAVATEPTITSGTLVTDDVAVFSVTYDNVNVGSTKTLTPAVTSILDGASVDMTGNYDVTLATANVGEITAKAVNVTAQTDTKVYDDNATSNVSPIGDTLEGTDVWTSEGIQVFSQSNVGTGLTLTASEALINDGNSGNNYVISYVTNDTGSITAKELTVTGSVVTSKTYDGNTDAVISGATLDGVETGDSVTLADNTSGTFDTKNVGAGKAVATVMTITGADAGNYTLIQPTVTGAITERAITVTAVTDAKIYDGTINSTEVPIITSGTLAFSDTANFIQTYDNVNVGSTKTLTPAVTSILDGASVDMTGNYDVTLATANVGEITAKAVNVTAQTDTKVYDDNATSNVSPIGDTLEGTDVWTSEGIQVFSQSNVGTGLTLTASEALINDGNSGNNYVISYVTNDTGSITAKELTVTGSVVTSKTYDGNTDAVISGATLDGVETGDSVTLADNTSGTFDTKNVGAGKAVATVMTITGADAGNYTLIQPTVTGAITERAINVTAQTDTKVYDGTTNSLVVPLVDTLAPGDSIATQPIQEFDTKDVDTGKTLTPSGLGITGGNGNYTVTYVVDATGEITEKPINITAQTCIKVYDGTTVCPEIPVVDPLALGDTVVTPPTIEFDDKHVGTGKTLTPSGLVIDDGNGGNNYDVAYVSNTTGVITEKPINVTAQTDTKVYDGTTASAVAPVVDALASGDSIATPPTQVFDTKDIGTGKTLTASGLLIDDGNGGNNYDISYVVDNTGVINDITAPVTTDNVPSGWQTSDVTVTFTCDDTTGGNSGCSKVYYTTNGDDPTTSSSFVDSGSSWQFTISIDGEYTIKYRGEDVAGNLEGVNTAANTLQLDKTAPEITNQIPPQGDTTSNATPTMSADYFDSGSGINVSSAIIKVDGMQIPEGFYIKIATSISYTPQNPLTYDFHTVIVEVSDNIGNTVNTEWTFQVAPIDEVAPTVSSWTPTDDSTEVSVNINPTITFSEPMDTSTLTYGNIELRKYSDSIVVSANINVDSDSQITITPDAALEHDTQYYFFIGTGVEDLAGNKFAANTWYENQKDDHEFTAVAEDVPVTTYNISLSAGWNLISLPLIPTNSDIATVLSGISANVDIVKHYNAGTGEWLSYVPDGNVGDLTTMEDGKGYWIFMDNTDSLIIIGSEMPDGGPQTLPAYSVVGNQWNLIGFKSVISMLVENYITQIGNDDVLWVYKNGYGLVHPSGTNSMESGYGYWLYPYSNGYSIVPTN